MNTANEKNGDPFKYLEDISGEIQLLALNIAVAAAKIAHRQDLGLELNQRLSQLVNQATQTVKQMNQILTAAGASKKNIGSCEIDDQRLPSNMMQDVENAMELIIHDSERITEILAQIKQRQG